MNTKSVNIIQWNCRGLKANYEEIKSLLCDNIPLIVSLQETLLNDNDNITFKNITYSIKPMYLLLMEEL